MIGEYKIASYLRRYNRFARNNYCMARRSIGIIAQFLLNDQTLDVCSTLPEDDLTYDNTQTEDFLKRYNQTGDGHRKEI